MMLIATFLLGISIGALLALALCALHDRLNPPAPRIYYVRRPERAPFTRGQSVRATDGRR